MNIGLPKELKDNEHRVGMVPSGVRALVADGHAVLVEEEAGPGSGFTDQVYIKAGGTVLKSAHEVYQRSDMVVKVKEPIKAEYSRLREGRIERDPALAGAANMERDLSLLRQLEDSSQPATIVRFYAWDKPTVSLGKHQKPESGADLEFCRRNHIPVVRRPSGGRAVLHADELTYAVISNDALSFPMHSLHETYRAVALALQSGLAQLGIESALARPSRTSSGRGAEARRGGRTNDPVQPHQSADHRLAAPCFVAPSRHELLCQGRKIAGSAQRRLRRAFLQHGSIPLTVDYPLMAAALGCSQELLRGTVISVSEAAGRPIGRQLLEPALVEGFKETFQISWTPL